MPRQQTGSPRWNATLACWVARVSMPDGTRKPVPLSQLTDPADAASAKTLAALVARRVREGGAVEVGSGEIVDEWFERWIAARIAKGLSSTSNDRGRYKKWIAPVIGHKPIAEVTRRDLEAIVQRLDAAVATSTRAETFDFRWKTATNVWGCCTKMFADACKSKVLELRVRDDNPARDVEGPDRGVERVGPYLFPAEFQAVMRSRRVPARWKRLIAIAVYTYTRRGELAALDWPAVNGERAYVHVHRSADRKKRIKPTKTKDTRKTPIEPTLAPLLDRMREDAGAEGLVVTSMPPIEEMPPKLRKYVRWGLEDAGMPVREDLFADDETRRPLSWHDLRHTGITWRAVRGDDPMKIMRSAGHSDMATTQLYINEAQTFEDAQTFGEPFPALDVPAMMGSANWAGTGLLGRAARFQDQKTSAAGASPTGFEPVLAA
jgi:integrase